MRYLVWTLLVWVPVIVLVSLIYATSTHGESGFNMAPPPGEIAGPVAGIGFLIYLFGLLLMWGSGRPAGRHSR